MTHLLNPDEPGGWGEGARLRREERRRAAALERATVTEPTATVAQSELVLLRCVARLASAYLAAPDVQDTRKLREAVAALQRWQETHR